MDMRLTEDVFEQASQCYRDDVEQKYDAIKDNADHSDTALEKLRRALESELATHNPSDMTAVVYGSFARREASAQSDLDYIGVGKSRAGMADVTRIIGETAEKQGLEKPNPKGSFGAFTTWKELSEDIGSKEESYNTMTRRVLLLMESVPIWGETYHDELLNKALEIYAKDAKTDSRKIFVFLMNDVIRYFRSIGVNYAHNKDQDAETGKWPIRNIKLRHSRVVMYLSLIAMIGVLSTYRAENKKECLKRLIGMTPLRRLHFAYHVANDHGFYKVAGAYNVFLSYMNEEKNREALENLEYEDRYQSREFSHLKANSDALASELTRFLFARRGHWNERFFEYLIL